MTDPRTACPRCWGRKFDPTGASNACLLCDGAGIVEDCALSAHFRFGELVTTSHRQFANDPDALQVEHLRRLCVDLLEPVRARVGPLRVSSGYRSRTLDAHVGGPEWLTDKISAHAVGYAADVVPASPGYSLRDVVDAVVASGAPFDQAILEGGCVHIGIRSPVGDRQRGDVLVRLAGPHPAGPRFIYARYDGSAKQLALVA